MANNALLPPSDDSNEEEDDEVKPKNRVKFGSIEVYKFGFAQGVDTVPSNGCVSLGIILFFFIFENFFLINSLGFLDRLLF